MEEVRHRLGMGRLRATLRTLVPSKGGIANEPGKVCQEK